MTEKFREYLLGHKCIVFTDNNPLSHLSSAKLGSTEQRWAAQLASFCLCVLETEAVTRLSGAEAVISSRIGIGPPMGLVGREGWSSLLAGLPF